jgi:excisionase family DNA binding protein
MEPAQNMSVPKLLSVAQVSAKLQCARSTVRKLIADGNLRASRIGSRTIRISETDFQAYLDGHANVSPFAVASSRPKEAIQ